MGDAIGLSIGATRIAGVQLGRAAVTRPSMPGVVDRVGDPVGIVGADGSVHRAERLVADALRGLVGDVTGGRAPTSRPVVAYPAHWRTTQVEALRSAFAGVLVTDAAAAITALQADPGVPARGVIVVCDFGGTGTSVTLLDASRGYTPVGPTVRHSDFSGDLIDQAVLSHVVTDVSAAAPVGATGTFALGPLHRLRAACRGAKERLSSVAVTALAVELPGFSGEVRMTRAELEELIRRPLAELIRVVDDTVTRAGVRPADVVAVASVGGGARIPLITTALSKHFRVPVITTPRPEMLAAIGAARRAAWGPAEDRSTAIVAAAAQPAFADADAQSSTFRALAWSEAHDVPPVVAPASLSGARPRLEFDAADEPVADAPPWYRRGPTLAGTATAAVLLLAASAVVAFGSDAPTRSTTAPLTPTTTSPSAAPASADPAPSAVEQDPPRTVYVSPAPPARHQAPVTQYVAPAPAAPAPPPSSEPPPAPPTETQTVTATVTQPPPSTQPSPQPPSSTQPRVTLTIPPIPPLPGLLPPHNR